MAPLLFALNLFDFLARLVSPQIDYRDPVSDALSMKPPPILGRKVPVMLGVMSECSDARKCEAVFDEVLEQVGNITSITLGFIGTLNFTEPVYGVTCKHGPSECALNVQELCAMTLYPQAQWWPFVTCINALYSPPTLEGGRKNVTDCAVENGMNSTLLAKCAGAGMGKGLLMGSVGRTKSMNVTTSCTVLIDHVKRCVVDDGEWLHCPDGHEPGDFVGMIKEAYDSYDSYE